VGVDGVADLADLALLDAAIGQRRIHRGAHVAVGAPHGGDEFQHGQIGRLHVGIDRHAHVAVVGRQGVEQAEITGKADGLVGIGQCGVIAFAVGVGLGAQHRGAHAHAGAQRFTTAGVGMHGLVKGVLGRHVGGRYSNGVGGGAQGLSCGQAAGKMLPVVPGAGAGLAY
jgi:hypothetical protein